MFDIEIGNEYIVTHLGTSEGTQVKYKKDGFWYKKNRDGREDLCEYLCSNILRFSNLNPEEYILYERGSINGVEGCRSKDFLKEEESIITIYRMYYNQYGKDITEDVNKFDDIRKRIDYVIEFVNKNVGLDISGYLAKLITLDRIILNEDRHFNNIALIEKDNKYTTAPIFDNGRSLLTANYSVRETYGLDRNVKCAIAKPFSGSYDKMYEILGKGFDLYYEDAIQWLKSQEDSFENKVLMYQLDRLKE